VRIFVLVIALALGACISARMEYQRVAELQPDLAHGREIYDSCARCHDAADGSRLYGKVPRLEGQHASVLIKELADYRRGQRWNDIMEEVAADHDLTQQAIADVAAYASQIAPPRVPAWTRPKPDEPGAVLYANRCEACHGPNGVGDAKRVIPRLGGQYYEYLVWQFYDVEHGHRQNMPGVHNKRLGKLPLDDILDIADFLSRSSPAPNKGP
jgi:cytochrome c553